MIRQNIILPRSSSVNFFTTEEFEADRVFAIKLTL